MSRKKVAEEFLANEVWWWRDKAEKHPFGFGVAYEPIKTWCDSRLAFHYELLIRIHRTRRLAPFTELKYPHLQILAALNDEPLVEPVFREDAMIGTENAKGWTKPTPKRQWNLLRSDKALIDAFKDTIKRERAVQEIPPPRPNAGQRNRRFSWQWPELMDISHFKLRPLNDSERGILTVARRTAKEKLQIFDKAIEDYLNPPESESPLHGLWAALEAEQDSEDSELDEWLGTFPPNKIRVRLWKGIWPLK